MDEVQSDPLIAMSEREAHSLEIVIKNTDQKTLASHRQIWFREIILEVTMNAWLRFMNSMKIVIPLHFI